MVSGAESDLGWDGSHRAGAPASSRCAPVQVTKDVRLQTSGDRDRFSAAALPHGCGVSKCHSVLITFKCKSKASAQTSHF